MVPILSVAKGCNSTGLFQNSSIISAGVHATDKYLTADSADNFLPQPGHLTSVLNRMIDTIMDLFRVEKHYPSISEVLFYVCFSAVLLYFPSVRARLC